MNTRAPTRFTKAHRADILARWRRRETLASIAAGLGVTVARVWHLKQQAIREEESGIDERPSRTNLRWTPELRAVILARWRAGETLASIAREFHVSRERIRQVVERARIEAAESAGEIGG